MIQPLRGPDPCGPIMPARRPVVDAWVGATLRIGALRMRVDKRDQRCVVVNIDPVTGARDPAILSAISRGRQACLGVYGSVAAPGAIGVGDPVVLDA